jgi:hypothetical protein
MRSLGLIQHSSSVNDDDHMALHVAKQTFIMFTITMKGLCSQTSTHVGSELNTYISVGHMLTAHLFTAAYSWYFNPNLEMRFKRVQPE